MGNKEKIDYLLADIRELEKLVASMRDAEIYPISFFSQSFATAQKIISGLHSIESDQVALFSRQMQEHKALLTEKEQAVPFTSPVREEAILPETEEIAEEIVQEEKEIIPEVVYEIRETEEKKAEQSARLAAKVTLDQALPHSISLNEVIQKKFLADFKKAFSLNDRFRFRRELFGGDENRMNKAIEDLNGLQSYEDSIDYLNEKLKWNIEDEAVADFIKLLEKRFS